MVTFFLMGYYVSVHINRYQHTRLNAWQDSDFSALHYNLENLTLMVIVILFLLVDYIKVQYQSNPNTNNFMMYDNLRAFAL